jgi:hypothetical protein
VLTRPSIDATARRATALAAALVFAGANGVAAQGVGFQGGFTVDPELGYVGSHVESRELVPGLYARPGVDGAFGRGWRVASVNVDVLYKYALGPTWKLYQGGGPVVHLVRVGDDTDVTGGLGGVFGFAHARGWFIEFRAAGGGGPALKFGLGVTLR